MFGWGKFEGIPDEEAGRWSLVWVCPDVSG